MRDVTALHFLLLMVSGWVNRRQLAAIEYLREENRVLREQLGDKRLRFTDAQRRRLALKGRALGRARLKELGTLVSPDTILRWHRRLVAEKYDGSGRRGPGRPRKSDEIRELVVQMAEENRTWGYTRIVGAMKNLGFDVARSTVAAILAERGLLPAPKRGRSMSWAEFLRAHWAAIGAMDFFTVEALTLQGLMRYLCLLTTSSSAKSLAFRHRVRGYPAAMFDLLWALLGAVRAGLRSRGELALENVALRQQLAVLKRSTKRAKLTNADRGFWLALSRLWPRWRDSLVVVKPETVIGWHRKGFRRYWTWRSRRRDGRPRVDPEIRRLVREMASANTGWGAPRIHGELLKLGFDVSDKPPSQGWRTFLDNHIGELAAIDFFVVPTATFRMLFVFVVLLHERRRIVHYNVTAHPSAQWTGQQMIEAFPYDSAPKYVVRDRDAVYGAEFQRRVDSMHIEQVLIAPALALAKCLRRACDRTLRRECFDHVIVLGERHLRRVLGRCLDYDHEVRTHLSLDKDAPEPRPRQTIDQGKVVALPMVGGLHHRYTRRAA